MSRPSTRSDALSPHHPPGQLGAYTLEAEVGRGGMGHVYRARHGWFGRRAAIKVLEARIATRRAVERFRRENTALRMLRHRHIVRAHGGVERSREGDFWYAMDFVGGSSVQELLRRHGPMHPARVLHLWRQMVSAVAAAHEAGLLHRDLKPSNILLRPATAWRHEEAVVIDFGLVRQLGDASEARLSQEGAIIGTPGYLPPEAYAGAESMDARSDVYALGLTCHAMLTGTTSYAPQVDAAPATLMHSPFVLGELIEACIARRPQDRPESAAALLGRIDALDMPGWTRRDALAALAEERVRAAASDAPTVDEVERVGASGLSLLAG